MMHRRLLTAQKVKMRMPQPKATPVLGTKAMKAMRVTKITRATKATSTTKGMKAMKGMSLPAPT